MLPARHGDGLSSLAGFGGLVFSGYRGWQLYPFQLLFSSVSRFLLFVPPSLWSTRQQLMNSVDDAIDVAEGWGARYLVPYADGGAPWYWDIGLGPRLDGLVQRLCEVNVVRRRQRRGCGRRGGWRCRDKSCVVPAR